MNSGYLWVAAVVVVVILQGIVFSYQPFVSDITPLMYRWLFSLVELGCIVPLIGMITSRRLGGR